jgi:hypothetical protein
VGAPGAAGLAWVRAQAGAVTTPRGRTQQLQGLLDLEQQLTHAENQQNLPEAEALLAQIHQYMLTNAGVLYTGSNPQTYAENAYDALLKHEQTAFRATTARAATGPTLLHQTASTIDPRAAFGAVATRVATDAAANEQERHLRELVEQQKDTITTLQSQLRKDDTMIAQLRQLVQQGARQLALLTPAATAARHGAPGGRAGPGARIL